MQKFQTANYFNQLLKKSSITQTELAHQLGYENSVQIISLWKTKRSKIPIAKVEQIAKVLEGDAQVFLTLALQEYYPEVWSVIENVMGAKFVTPAELNILNCVRERAGYYAAEPKTAKQKAALQEQVSEWLLTSDDPLWAQKQQEELKAAQESKKEGKKA
ncbi:hypothetical protein [Achromobacter sp. AGC39]